MASRRVLRGSRRGGTCPAPGPSPATLSRFGVVRSAAGEALPAASAATATSSRARPLRPCGPDMLFYSDAATRALDDSNEGVGQSQPLYLKKAASDPAVAAIPPA